MFFSKSAVTRTQAALVIVVIVIAVVGVGLMYNSSFVSPPTSQTTAQPGSKMVDTLSIDDWEWPIDDLNELYAVSALPWPNWLAYTVYQPLVSVNETAEYQSGTIQFLPGLASWTVSPDGLTYTFDLKQNVKFSNGDPLNAYQVWAQMYGLYYLSGNSSAWLISYAVFDMSTAKFGPATIDLLTKSGLINPSQAALKIMTDSSWPIYVTGPNQIAFRLIAPFPWFPGLLIAFDALIFDTQWVLENGAFGTPASFNSYFNQHAIPGTGPYMVSSMAENSFVKFVQNPNYWGANMTADEINQQPIFDPGHAKTVVVYAKTDDLSRYTDLSNGAVQLAAIQAPDWNLVTSNPQTYSYLKLQPWNGQVALIGLNVNLYPTNIQEVRQAIVHGINYTDIYQKAYLGAMYPYVGPEYPEWKDFYNLGNYAPYDYNPSEAKQYIAQAETTYPNLTSVPLVLRMPSGCSACTNAAQVIQSNLADLGITVNILVVSPSTYYSVYGSYDTNVANAAQIGQLSFVNGGYGWGPGTLSPVDYWNCFVSRKSIWGNWAGYYNPVVQKAIDAFYTPDATNTAFMQGLVKDAQAQIYKDAPYAWLGTFGLWEPPGGSIVWKTGVVTGFYVDPVFTGQDTAPLFNTVIFGPNA